MVHLLEKEPKSSSLTGIRITHDEFQGRASWGANFIDTLDQDCNGHGTHVAGTVAGVSYGVAKKSTVIAVKVLDCQGSGSWTAVIKGVEYTANSANRKNAKAIANMSLGGGFNKALNDAVAAAVQSGVTFAVAAGNSNDNACLYSPASEATAISVGASDISNEISSQKDVRAYYSNFGSCVDIFAPGTLIKSAWYTSNTATNTISGTSMATPHIAGVAALYLAENPSATPQEIELFLVSQSTQGVIDMQCRTTECNKSPNKMLYSSC